MTDGDWRKPYLTAAEQRVSREVAILTAEKDALQEFRDHLNSPAPSSTTFLQPALGTITSGAAPVDNVVVEAYRETFMALEHYDAEYGEPALESIREEFGEQVATLVGSRSEIAREPAIRAALQGIVNREAVLKRLKVETEHLSSSRGDFEAVHAQLEDIQAAIDDPEAQSDCYEALEQLDDLEDTCERLLADRQRCLLEHDAELSHHEFGFVGYLYRPLEVDFPILATLGTLCRRIKTVRWNVHAALAERDYYAESQSSRSTAVSD